MVYGHVVKSHEPPPETVTPEALTITIAPMRQMCQPPPSYRRSTVVAWDTECYFDTYVSENATQPPPEPPDLLLTKRVPLGSTWAMYRAESEDDCTTHGAHTSTPPAGDGRPVTSILSVHAAGILTEEKKSTIMTRPTRQKPLMKYFLTSASAKVGLSATGDTEFPTCP